MGFVFYNPNPLKKHVGDCVIRAISKATGQTWERTYTELCLQGFMMSDLPSSNQVWGNYLIQKGFNEHSLLRKCISCYNVIDFCNDHPVGTFVLGTDSHAVCIINGYYYDSFDSGDMNPTYYFEKITKEEETNE